MSLLKACSQAGHCFTAALHSCFQLDPERHDAYLGHDGYGIKVAMYAKNLNALLIGHQQALAAGLPCALIVDSAFTVFDEPTITGLGIGPCHRSEVDRITKRYNMHYKST